MKKFDEYIIPINETAKDYDEMFVGIIRRQPVLTRCKDCKHYDGYYCHNKWWGNGYGNYTPPIKDEDGFCDWAERKDNG
jgi:hypothetical protein